MFKSNALSNIDIINILKSQKIKINGVFMKDELPSKLKRGFYVINLQSSNVGNGSHWTALYYRPKKSFYFDAFGFRVQPELWTEAVFSRMYNALKPGGILVTYAARGIVKRNMMQVGFTVEKLEGPPGKREMFRARKA